MSYSTTETSAGRTPLGADLILPLLAVGLTIYYLMDTAGLAWEAKATGVIVGVVLLALCAVQIVRVLAGVAAGRASLDLGALIADTTHNRRRLALVVLAALFIGTIGIVGTTLGLFLLLFGSMWIMGVRSPATLLGVSAVTAGVVYGLLILLLGTRLPRGMVENMLALFGVGA